MNPGDLLTQGVRDLVLPFDFFDLVIIRLAPIVWSSNPVEHEARTRVCSGSEEAVQVKAHQVVTSHNTHYAKKAVWGCPLSTRPFLHNVDDICEVRLFILDAKI